LVREFAARLAAEFEDSAGEPTSAQIVEICRVVRLTGAESSGGLLEALAESLDIELFRALVARSQTAPTDEGAARADVEGGLLKLELARVESRCALLAQALSSGGGAEQAAELRELLRQQAELKRRVVEAAAA
jgi:hypothetical protein